MVVTSDVTFNKLSSLQKKFETTIQCVINQVQNAINKFKNNHSIKMIISKINPGKIYSFSSVPPSEIKLKILISKSQSSKMISQENLLCFQISSIKTWTNVQKSKFSIWFQTSRCNLVQQKEMRNLKRQT